MQKTSIWQILFYFSLMIITLWLILKSVGIIQTPFWLEYGVPVGSLILGLFCFYRDILKGIHALGYSVAVLSTKVVHVESDIRELTRDVNIFKTKLSGVEHRLGLIEQKL